MTSQPLSMTYSGEEFCKMLTGTSAVTKVYSSSSLLVATPDNQPLFLVQNFYVPDLLE